MTVKLKAGLGIHRGVLYNRVRKDRVNLNKVIAVPDKEEQQAIRDKLQELRVEHSDLDDIIARLADQPSMDQLRLRRLKNRKLLLKDIIAKLESQLIPDMDA